MQPGLLIPTVKANQLCIIRFIPHIRRNSGVVKCIRKTGVIIGNDVLRRGNRNRAVLDQLIGSNKFIVIDTAGHCKNLASLLQRAACRNQGSGLFRRRNDQHTGRKSAQYAVAFRKMAGIRAHTRRIFRNQAAVPGQNTIVDSAAGGRITDIHAAAQNRNRSGSGIECAGICRRVNAFCHARHHKHSLLCQFVSKTIGDFIGAFAGFPCSDNSHRGFFIKRRHMTAHIQKYRRYLYIPQAVWICRILHRNNADMILPAIGDDIARIVQIPLHGNGFSCRLSQPGFAQLRFRRFIDPLRIGKTV